MPRKKPTRIKAAAIAVPSSQEQAEALLADIGRLQRDVSRIEADMNDKLSKIKYKFEVDAQPLNDQVDVKFQALHAWAEANRDKLLKGRAKTVRLASGEISWRTTPPRVTVRGLDRVIETLKRIGRTDLLRTKEEINKEAILADPQSVDGIKKIGISQREEFVAKPFESQIECAEPVKKREAA